MLKQIFGWSLLLIVASANTSLLAAPPARDSKQAVVWNLDSLETIGGHKVTVVGQPRVIDTDKGKAIEFNGKGDGLFVANNPLDGLQQFTAEVIFRPAANGPKEQRFVNFQSDNDKGRALFETRLTLDGQWFLDAYLKTPKADKTLFAKDFLHPIGPWYHAAIVVDGKTMRHYVNGKEELAADIPMIPQGPGQTSLGMRFNQVFWYQGAIRQLRITPSVLEPEEFLKP